jgi:hypothetical protein
MTENFMSRTAISTPPHPTTHSKLQKLNYSNQIRTRTKLILCRIHYIFWPEK